MKISTIKIVATGLILFPFYTFSVIYFGGVNNKKPEITLHQEIYIKAVCSDTTLTKNYLK